MAILLKSKSNSPRKDATRQLKAALLELPIKRDKRTPTAPYPIHPPPFSRPHPTESRKLLENPVFSYPVDFIDKTGPDESPIPSRDLKKQDMYFYPSFTVLFQPLYPIDFINKTFISPHQTPVQDLLLLKPQTALFLFFKNEFFLYLVR